MGARGWGGGAQIAGLVLETRHSENTFKVAKSSANEHVGTGFASWYRLQPRAGSSRPNGWV